MFNLELIILIVIGVLIIIGFWFEPYIIKFENFIINKIHNIKAVNEDE